MMLYFKYSGQDNLFYFACSKIQEVTLMQKQMYIIAMKRYDQYVFYNMHTKKIVKILNDHSQNCSRSDHQKPPLINYT